MSELDYYSEAAHGPHEVLKLGNYQLESGITLPTARIAYKTHGTLNAAKIMWCCSRTCGRAHRRRWRPLSARIARSSFLLVVEEGGLRRTGRLKTDVPLSGDRGFEPVSLQQGV
jgi:hypothetical protein